MKTHSAMIALLFAGLAHAQVPFSTVALVRKRLGAADPAAAEAAMLDLIRGGAPNVPVLRAVLACKPAPPVSTRAERALAICLVDAPEKDGVKVGLFVDRSEAKPGDTITFTVRLCNVSPAPIEMCLGMSYSGNALVNALALNQAVPGNEAGQQARFGDVDFCGTRARPIVVKLDSFTTHDFTTVVTYRTEPSADSYFHDKGPHLESDRGRVFLPLEPTADGEVTLRVRHTLSILPAQQDSGRDKPTWAGTLQSNSVTLRLHPAVR